MPPPVFIDRALPRAHLWLVALWSACQLSRVAGFATWLSERPSGSAVLQAVSLLVLLAVVALVLWIAWATLRRPTWSRWVCLVALAAALAVPEPRPDALDVAWLLIVVPLSALALDRPGRLGTTNG